MVCRICHNSKTNRTFEVREMMFGFREQFSYFQCGCCGCLQIADIPADMSKYYPSAYYSFTQLPVEQFKNPVKKIFKQYRDRYAIFNCGILGKFIYQQFPNLYLRSLSAVTELTQHTRILDVGCGAGAILYALKENGFTHVLGIDPYLETDIEYKNGLTILKKSIYQLSGEWEVIMLHHVFEHMPDQLEFLQTAAKLLSEKGTCVIRTPTASSFAWEHYGVNWVQLDAPRHFFIHSVESMKLLAHKAGFYVKKNIYDSTDFQFWGSEQYCKDIPLLSENSYAVNLSRSIFSPSEITAFKQKAKALNLKERGDSTAFYLTMP